MDYIFIEKLSKLQLLLSKFYSCKFVTEEKEEFLTYPSLKEGCESFLKNSPGSMLLWIKTHKSNKEIKGGFVPNNRDLHFGSTFRVSKSGRKNVNYGDVYIHNKISVTHNGIIFIDKPNILVDRGPASLTFVTDDTIDVIPQDYQHENSYIDLKNNFPNIKTNLLNAIYYFCINPVQKGIQVEIDVDCVNHSILIIERLGEKVSIL